MNRVYELLARHDIYEMADAESLKEWAPSELRDLTFRIDEAIRESEKPFSPTEEWDRFSFLANGALSGLSFPCAHPGHRVKRVDQMARFAALYADEVIAQNPVSIPPVGALELPSSVKIRVANDVFVLLSLKPLVKAGIIGVYSKHHNFCEKHVPPFVESGQIDQIERAVWSIAKERLSFDVRPEDDLVQVHDPDGIVAQHDLSFVTTEKTDSFPSDENEQSEWMLQSALDSICSTVIEDLFQQAVHNYWFDRTYLSDRVIDMEALSAINEDGARLRSDGLLEGLSHTVPVVTDASIHELLTVRQREEEAFRVYRDAINEVLKEVDTDNHERIREAFEDVIVPKLNKLDQRVESARDRLEDELGRTVTLGAGAVMIGLTLGAVSPELAKTLIEVSGVGFGGRILDKLGTEKIPKEVKNSNYYFLWKLRGGTRKRN